MLCSKAQEWDELLVALQGRPRVGQLDLGKMAAQPLNDDGDLRLWPVRRPGLVRAITWIRAIVDDHRNGLRVQGDDVLWLALVGDLPPDDQGLDSVEIDGTRLNGAARSRPNHSPSGEVIRRSSGHPEEPDKGAVPRRVVEREDGGRHGAIVGGEDVGDAANDDGSGGGIDPHVRPRIEANRHRCRSGRVRLW